jgi:acetolactate synthase regulatory subunit
VPPALLSRDEVIERLMRVVRRAGYDGASLA